MSAYDPDIQKMLDVFDERAEALRKATAGKWLLAWLADWYIRRQSKRVRAAAEETQLARLQSKLRTLEYGLKLRKEHA